MFLCMSNNCKETMHTKHIDRIINFVRNSEESNIHKTVWYEGGLQLADIGTNNVRVDELNTILGWIFYSKTWQFI